MRLSVLVVEYELLTLDTICHMVEAAGHLAFRAATQEMALAILDGIRIDVVVTSLALGHVIDGLAFAATIKESRPGVAVLLSSGSDTLRLSSYPQIDGFIRKPFGVNAIAHALKEAVVASNRK